MGCCGHEVGERGGVYDGEDVVGGKRGVVVVGEVEMVGGLGGGAGRGMPTTWWHGLGRTSIGVECLRHGVRRWGGRKMV